MQFLVLARRCKSSTQVVPGLNDCPSENCGGHAALERHRFLILDHISGMHARFWKNLCATPETESR